MYVKWRKRFLEHASSTDAMQTSKGNDGEVKGALSAAPAKTVFIT